ncbi:hypothetical protein MM_2926 [Methanosarcina mazei Go1]|uniref:Uncharacterized protein n=1 Tax=Methanosarcina mazei (strain ATCC BAA-159 / DSM 3647 / Goe1 / Go1 / JCM 11833 / OCM 88) TaxID=192952 RepID=Q8PSZ7_METMA|nr:hypothetical protein MM_2926 [Methanosarcina mazei Go1]
MFKIFNTDLYSFTSYNIFYFSTETTEKTNLRFLILYRCLQSYNLIKLKKGSASLKESFCRLFKSQTNYGTRVFIA